MRLSETEFVRRGARIQELLRPISRQTTGPAYSRIPVSTSQVIIAAHDEARPGSHYRDWRFTIDVAKHHGMYFEAWRLDSRNRFVLDQAYLNVYERIGSGEREIICLHCDPSLAAGSDHERYKRGPHIHMSVAGFPFARAHIALQGPDLGPVLRSTQTLHAALAWGVQMIRDEVLVLLRSTN